MTIRAAKAVSARAVQRLPRYVQLFGKSVGAAGRVDARLSIALFLASLISSCYHWFQVLPYIGVDAARLGLYAHDLLQEGIFPFYVYHQFAPHPLLIYLQALVFALFGSGVVSLQAITVVGGALTAPAVYYVCRWLFADQGTVFSRRAGAVAALCLGTSVYLISYAIKGFEVVLLAPVEAGAAAFLWRGFRRGGRLDFGRGRSARWPESVCLHRGALSPCRPGGGLPGRDLGRSPACWHGGADCCGRQPPPP